MRRKRLIKGFDAIKNTTYRAWPVPRWLLSRPVVMSLTYGTLVLELSLGTLIWIRELRHPLVVLGILLHLGLDYALNLQLFGCLMVICLLLFVDPVVVLSILGS